MRRWLWVLVIVGCGRDRAAQPPPPPPLPAPDPTPAAPAPDAPPATTALVTIPLPSPRPIDWFVQALTADGKHVLLVENDETHELHYRVVGLPGGAIESDVDLPAISALPRETINDDASVKQVKLDLDATAIAEELREIGPVLAPFPLGAGGRIAAAPDGRHVAFNAGDWVYTASDGKILTRVASQASYRPKFTPDGKTLLFERINGTIDGVEGKYELYATSIDGKQPPRRLAGTAGIHEAFALTDAGTLRTIVTHEPKIPTCVVEIGLAAPYPVTKLGCLPEHEEAMGCVMSPKGAWIACQTDKELPELDPNSTTTLRDGGVVHDHQLRFRNRSMEAATGKIGADRIGPGPSSAISDAGVLVIDAVHGELAVLDAHGAEGTVAVGDAFTLFGRFFDPAHVVASSEDKLYVIDVR